MSGRSYEQGYLDGYNAGMNEVRKWAVELSSHPNRRPEEIIQHAMKLVAYVSEGKSE